jgi:signal transduction histidine kinase
MTQVPEAGVDAGLRQRAWHAYQALLLADRSPLLASEPSLMRIRRQLHSILDEVADLRTAEDGDQPVALARPVDTERAWARAESNPVLSLRAASLLFQAAFPLLAQRYHDWGIENPEQRAAVNLNRAIMDRLEAVVAGCVDQLLTKLHRSGQDERRSLSRELHDTAGHELALALQRLELYDLRMAAGDADAADTLRQVHDNLDRLNSGIRELSSRLRLNVSEVGLLAALRHYCASVPATIRTRLMIDPAVALLPSCYAEELFLLLREAIRNAVAHSHADTITISVELRGTELRALVADDGDGFTPDGEPDHHLGLISMAERAELLGGALAITATPESGTRVQFRSQLRLTLPEPAGAEDG